MHTLIIPAIILVVTIPFIILSIRNGWDDPWPSLPTIILIGCLVMTLVLCPCLYLGSRSKAWKAEIYYEQIISPNIIEEGQDYVVVENIEAGIWQAGDNTVVSYNNYLRVTRHWQHVPIVNSTIYPVPEHLKYVRIGN